ncbi:MAG TPA: hypothetical protein ENL18_02735 [Thermoplasmatales archaeon]|nr:hypothetical protein [Thermoplasmatales archaeon]
MRKYILFVDLLLIAVFIFLVASKVITIPATKIVQPIFMILIAVHLLQHWKILVASVKRMRK